MKTLSIFLPILICYYFEAISARSIPNSKKDYVRQWLDMELKDINEQCKKNLNDSIKAVIYRDYQMKYLQFWDPIENGDIDLSEHVFDLIYNPSLMEKMKDLIEHIQSCLDEEKRLDSKGLRLVIGDTLYLHSLKVIETEPNSYEDMEKCRKIGKDKVEKCVKSFENIFYPDPFEKESSTILDLLTVNFVGKSSCEEILPLEQCFMEAMSPCSPKLKKMFKMALSPPKEMVCENFLQETEPNSDLNDLFNKKHDNTIIRLG